SDIPYWRLLSRLIRRDNLMRVEIQQGLIKSLASNLSRLSERARADIFLERLHWRTFFPDEFLMQLDEFCNEIDPEWRIVLDNESLKAPELNLPNIVPDSTMTTAVANIQIQEENELLDYKNHSNDELAISDD